jgi:YegS/Rv2252/BmrU family lipid kinase
MVVNPQSQNGALGRRWPELAGVIRRELPFDEVRTRGPGDATRLTREALAGGADRVVAIGGDGTINEVINGFFEGDKLVRAGAQLGVLPFGTGGDFRKSIHMPRDPSAAARILARGRTRRIDVGLLELTGHDGHPTTRVFANIASFGISGLVDQLVNTTTKALGGRISFMIATARAGLRYKNQRVRLVFDGAEDAAVEATINTVAVANGRYFGGGMYIAPKAELDDGQFDVVVLGDLSPVDMIVNGPRIYSGTHLKLPRVSSRRCKTMRAEPVDGDAVELDVDGENPGILPASFRILPAALDLVVPG